MMELAVGHDRWACDLRPLLGTERAGICAHPYDLAGWLVAAAASRLVRPPVEVAIVGDAADAGTAELTRTAYRRAPAGSVIMVGLPDTPGLALLADRQLRDGRATAYVCRGFVCRLPVTEPAELAAQLTALAWGGLSRAPLNSTAPDHEERP